LTVIGVAAATRAFTLDQPEGWAAYYRPAGIDTSVAQATLLVRSADADRTARDVIAVVRSVGGIRVGRVGTLTAFIAEAIASRRLQGWLFGGFAAAGLAILLAGVLGQATMAAARRRREVGIRLALGATRQRIVRLFVQDQSRGVFVGLLAGSLASVWTARALDTYLFRIDAFDPSLWTIAVFAVAVVSASGAVAPSLRASRIDPAATLKAE
jgi:hypothetical protein